MESCSLICRLHVSGVVYKRGRSEEGLCIFKPEHQPESYENGVDQPDGDGWQKVEGCRAQHDWMAT
jgi:hypothetical protein